MKEEVESNKESRKSKREKEINLYGEKEKVESKSKK